MVVGVCDLFFISVPYLDVCQFDVVAAFGMLWVLGAFPDIGHVERRGWVDGKPKVLPV